MYRTLPYVALFAVSALLQVFLFDNLAISVYLNPLIYVAFIILLPLDIPPVVLLLLGLLTGVTMDWATGGAGLNTAATLPVARLRPALIDSFYGHENAREGGIPSVARFGSRRFLEYLVTMVAVHHALFFLLESLSWSHLLHTVVRIAVSGAVSVGFIWLIARIFTSKLSVRV